MKKIFILIAVASLLFTSCDSPKDLIGTWQHVLTWEDEGKVGYPLEEDGVTTWHSVQGIRSERETETYIFNEGGDFSYKRVEWEKVVPTGDDAQIYQPIEREQTLEAEGSWYYASGNKIGITMTTLNDQEENTRIYDFILIDNKLILSASANGVELTKVE